MVINTRFFNWWYDSAATAHICIDKYFKNVKEDKYFMMHNNIKAKLIGKGVVDLSFISKKITLVDVISTIMLCRNGNKAVLEVENLILLKKICFF